MFRELVRQPALTSKRFFTQAQLRTLDVARRMGFHGRRDLLRLPGVPNV